MSDDLDFSNVRSNLERRLNYCFTQHESASRRFVRNGKTREIFDTDRLDRLFRSLFSLEDDSLSRQTRENRLRATIRFIRGKSGTSNPGCCNILATLLYTRCQDRTLQAFEQNLHDSEIQECLNDDKLPFERPHCTRLFGDDDGPRFWEGQMPFCAVRFKENDQVNYVGTRASSRFPFVKDLVRIGEGSFGIVYKGIIEKGHLINKNNEATLARKAYAIKKFKNYDTKVMEAEGAIVQQIVQATKKHDNILVTRASIQIGDSYYLVFDLAKYDLWRLFKDRSEPPLSTLTQKMTFLSCFIGLAGGLAYLHDELSVALPERNQLLRCYHLDLKPQNILVFTEDGNTILRFTDFGISRIKHIEPQSLGDDSDDPIYSLDKIFRPSPMTEPSSGIDNTRYGGTYAPPEAVAPNGKVTRKSDVWGFGTVLTLAITYTQYGWDGIMDFAHARSLDRDDRFFDMPTDDESACVLHSSVVQQLDKLIEKASGESDVEEHIFRLVSDLLKGRILRPRAADRVYAREVEDSLRSIHATFSNRDRLATRSGHQADLTHFRTTPSPNIARIPKQPLLAPLVRSRTLPAGSDITEIINMDHHELGQREVLPRHNTTRQLLRRARDRILRRDSRVLTNVIPLPLPYAMGICKLSMNGKYLAIGGDSLVVIISLSDLQPGQVSPIFVGLPPPEGQQWTDFAIGSKYVCVAVDAGCFECTFIPTSPDGTVGQRTITRSAEAPIYRVALSPNAAFVAFVLRDMEYSGNALRLLICRTTDVISLPLARYSIDTPLTPSSSDAERLDSEFVWPRIISQPEELDLPVGADIFDLKFSKNGNALILVTRPYQRDQERQYDIITWDLIRGQKVSHFRNVEKSTVDADNLWKPATYAIFPHAPRYTVASKKGICIGDFTAPTGGWRERSESLDGEIIDVFIPEDEQQLMILGRTPSSRNEVKAFEIPMNGVKGLKSFLKRGMDTGFSEYDVETDSFRVRIDPRSGRRELVVARLEGEGKTCLVSRTYLE